MTSTCHMCGRYTLTVDNSTIERRFGAKFYIAKASYDYVVSTCLPTGGQASTRYDASHGSRLLGLSPALHPMRMRPQEGSSIQRCRLRGHLQSRAIANSDDHLEMNQKLAPKEPSKQMLPRAAQMPIMWKRSAFSIFCFQSLGGASRGSNRVLRHLWAPYLWPAVQSIRGAR